MKKLAAALITSLFATVAFAQAPATTPAPAHKTTKHMHKVSHHVTHKKAAQ